MSDGNLYIANAFSINMIQYFPASYSFDELSSDTVSQILKSRYFFSAIGHADLANVISEQLGVFVPAVRTSLQLQPNDWLIVAQYIGPRLEEGTTSLPEGAQIRYFLVSDNNS